MFLPRTRCLVTATSELRSYEMSYPQGVHCRVCSYTICTRENFLHRLGSTPSAFRPQKGMHDIDVIHTWKDMTYLQERNVFCTIQGIHTFNTASRCEYTDLAGRTENKHTCCTWSFAARGKVNCAKPLSAATREEEILLNNLNTSSPTKQG